ncbi:hypothetical protein 13VV501A_gene0016 [Vibrio phage 13VV501A]|nr:hypothetical protein 13VV501A_gene0016 [Vibrio phage 13VV501A]
MQHEYKHLTVYEVKSGGVKIEPAKNDRIFAISKERGKLYLEEQCEMCFGSYYTKEEMLEMLDELKHAVTNHL